MNNTALTEYEQRELVRQVLTFPKKLGAVNFPLVVKESTGYDIIGIDLSNDYDKSLISTLRQKLDESRKASRKTGQHFRGNRINDVGSQIEISVVRDLNSSPFNVEQLGEKGYPDIEITFDNEPVYMELKTSAVIKKSGYRYFYYSTGKKVKKTARHLLLSILVESPDRGYWNVQSFVISDLSRLKVRLKAEFNASKTDLMNEEARIATVP